MRSNLESVIRNIFAVVCIGIIYYMLISFAVMHYNDQKKATNIKVGQMYEVSYDDPFWKKDTQIIIDIKGEYVQYRSIMSDQLWSSKKRYYISSSKRLIN